MAAAVKHVIVCGGGMTGWRIVRLLESQPLHFRVTLVDRKDHHENPTGAARSLCDPAFMSQTAKPHAQWVQSATLVIGSLLEVNRKYIVVQGIGQEKQKLDFDFLVVATGHRYPLFKPGALTLDQVCDSDTHRSGTCHILN
jgi:NADH dehydrogenase FAD-containing subunit